MMRVRFETLNAAGAVTESWSREDITSAWLWDQAGHWLGLGLNQTTGALRVETKAPLTDADWDRMQEELGSFLFKALWYVGLYVLCVLFAAYLLHNAIKSFVSWRLGVSMARVNKVFSWRVVARCCCIPCYHTPSWWMALQCESERDLDKIDRWMQEWENVAPLQSCCDFRCRSRCPWD
jgi:hypothetical protein